MRFVFCTWLKIHISLKICSIISSGVVRHAAQSNWQQWVSCISKMNLVMNLTFCMWLRIYKYDLVCWNGCGQSHLGMQDGKTKLVMMLSFCMQIGIHRNSKLIAISTSLTVWFLNFALKILSANQIAWFLHIKYLQNGLIFWLQFLYNSLASWLKPTEQILVIDGFWDSLWMFLEIKLVLN